MLSLPKGMSPNDVRQWLSRGWFLAKHKGNLEVATMAEIGTTYALCYVGSPKTVTKIRFKDLRAIWPVCGAVNFDGYAVYITRIPRQQYCRTFDPGQVQVTMPNKWEFIKAGGKQPNLQLRRGSFEDVRRVMFPEYFSLRQAQNKLTEGWASVAINPYITLAKEATGVSVYLRQDNVGIMDNTGQYRPNEENNEPHSVDYVNKLLRKQA